MTIARTRKHKDGSIELAVTGKMAALLRGELSVRDMDSEELARGQFKDKLGRFSRPPSVVPHEVYMSMRRELLRRGDQMFAEGYEAAIKAFVSIATDESVSASDRLKAAQYVIERIGGKVPDKVEVTGDPRWLQMIKNVVVEHGGFDDDDIVDAEVVE